jgi:hypothetical protein
MMKAKLPKKKLYSVNFTRLELAHVRDLFSVMLTTSLEESVSQKLASVKETPLVEASAWQKIVAACEAANLVVGDKAPDFVVAVSAPSPVSVYQLTHDEPVDSLVESNVNDIFERLKSKEEKKDDRVKDR